MSRALWIRFAGSLVVLASAGCSTFSSPALDAALAEEDYRPAVSPDVGPAKDDSARSAATPSRSLSHAEAALTSLGTQRDATGKKSTGPETGWYRLADAAPAADNPYRWQHNALNAVLQTERDPAALLTAASESKQSEIAATARLGLARLSPADHVATLDALSRASGLAKSIRAAAIEMLAQSDLESGQDAFARLAADLGPKAHGAVAEPFLYREVVRGLALSQRAESEPLLVAAATAADGESQHLALQALAKRKAAAALPAAKMLIHHADARLRGAALAVLVACEDAEALPRAKEALADTDLYVRLAAVEALGNLHAPEALALLQSRTAEPTERMREAVAVALVAQQDWTTVARMAGDKSNRVRAGIAQALKNHAAAERVPLAERLLREGSPSVQEKLLAALSAWPLELAGPLALEALASPHYRTRSAAQQMLARHFKDAERFAVGAGPAERAEQLARLRAAWERAYPAGATPSQSASLAAANASKAGAPSGEDTYQAALELLDRNESGLRREGAQRIAQLAQSEAMSPAAGATWCAALRREADVGVWRETFVAAERLLALPGHAAIAHDVAAVGLASTDDLIVRQALAFCAVHGNKDHAANVMRHLNARDSSLVEAALQALTRCGPATDREPLYRLLASRHVRQQVLAAQALAAWNDPRGLAGLERLAQASSPETRRQAIAAIAAAQARSLVPTLLAALDDQPSVQVAALQALPTVTGVNPLADADPTPVTAAARARTWQAWYAQNGVRLHFPIPDSP